MLSISKEKQEPYKLFLWTVTAIGLALTAWAIVIIYQNTVDSRLLLLAGMVLVTSYNSSSMKVSDKTGITYEIGGALTFAAIPLFGISGAILIQLLRNVALWFFKPRDQGTWKKHLPQLCFNSGMHVISIACAGLVLLWLRTGWGVDSILSWTLAWFIAALVDEILNLGIFSIILYLQHGPDFDLIDFLSSNRWAMPISILTMAIGGSIMAYTFEAYDWIAAIIFFLPIFLSGYAWLIYVSRMQGNMDQLEETIAERTADLQQRTDSLAVRSQELADLNRQKDAYLAVLTHDMMTPLSNIQLCTDILSDDPDLESDNRELLNVMRRSQKMLFVMISNILDIEKLRAGKDLSLIKTPLDLIKLGSQTLDLVRAEAQEKQQKLRFESTETQLVAEIDQSQFERILLNLLSNGLKYTPENGEIVLKVSKIENQSDPYAQIEVIDNGIGIPAEELPFVFERFRRVAELPDKITGTGLGLAITKALVEEHDGTIEAKSEVGVGSEFKILIPV